MLRCEDHALLRRYVSTPDDQHCTAWYLTSGGAEPCSDVMTPSKAGTALKIQVNAAGADNSICAGQARGGISGRLRRFAGLGVRQVGAVRGLRQLVATARYSGSHIVCCGLLV
jgi:hypothetical protein